MDSLVKLSGVLFLMKSFLGAVLDTLLYVLKDGLLRLTNVRKLQCAKKCGKQLLNMNICVLRWTEIQEHTLQTDRQTDRPSDSWTDRQT